MTKMKWNVESMGYRIDRREDVARKAPCVFSAQVEGRNGDYVLWDPKDDAHGFCLLGRDPEKLDRRGARDLGIEVS